MSKDNVEATFQNGSSRKRAVISLTIFGSIMFIAGVGKVASGGAPFLVAGVAMLIVAYRNRIAGLYVTAEAVIVRNITSTRRIPLGQVSRAQYVPGTSGITQWGYINVGTTEGELVRVTALRRAPPDGDDLVRSINSELSKRRSAG